MKKIITIIATSLLLVTASNANALLLDNWNDADLDASNDYVNVGFGDDGSGNTWFSLSWSAGSENELDALGLDTVFYNCIDCGTDGYGSVLSVFEGTDFSTANDVTSDWKTNFGGDESGGGFGSFSSHKNLDSAGRDGLDPNILFFLLNGSVTFAENDDGSSFAVHVRYEEDCSGWVSNGTPSTSTSGKCGGASVPEPGVLALLAIGLLGVAGVAGVRRF